MAERFAVLSADVIANTATWNSDLKKAAANANSFNAKTNKALASTRRGLDRTKKSFASFAKRAFSLRSIVVTLAGAGGLGLLSKRAIELGDNIAKTADLIGIGTEALQEYRAIADLAGVSNQALDKGFETLSRRIAEARSGTGEFLKVTEQYGIALSDINLRQRSYNNILDDIIGAVQNAATQQERLNIVYQATGRSSIRLTGLFAKGTEEINKQREAVRAAGTVLSEDFVRRQEEMNDQLTEAGLKITVASAKLGDVFSPALVSSKELLADFVDTMAGGLTVIRDFGREIGLFDPAAVEGVKAIQRAIAETSLEIVRLRKERDALKKAPIIAQIFRGDINEEIGPLLGRLQRLKAELAEIASASPVPLEITITPPIARTVEQLRELETALNKAAGAATPGPRSRSEPGQAPAFGAPTPDLASALPSLDPLVSDQNESARLFLVQQANAKAMFAALATGNKELIATLEIRNELGILPPDVEARLVAAKLATDEMTSSNEILSRTITSVGDAAADAFASFVTRSKTAKEAALDLARSLSRIGTDVFVKQFLTGAIQSGAASLFSGGFSFGGGGSGAGSQLGPIGLAGGGPAQAGRPFLVGEVGPEIFVPRTSGQVVPAARSADMLAAGGGGMTINNFISTPDIDSFNARLPQLSSGTAREFSREGARLN